MDLSDGVVAWPNEPIERASAAITTFMVPPGESTQYHIPAGLKLRLPPDDCSIRNERNCDPAPTQNRPALGSQEFASLSAHRVETRAAGSAGRCSHRYRAKSAPHRCGFFRGGVTARQFRPARHTSRGLERLPRGEH